MTTNTTNSECVFFLGGIDGEMIAIKKHLETLGLEYQDKKLGWGAKASDYKEGILQAVKDGKTPVLIELEVDFSLPEKAIVIDHHGDRSGECPAIIQFLSLVGIKPTREDILIGAMDAGYIFGLDSIGAKKTEIAKFLSCNDSNMSLKEMLLSSEVIYDDKDDDENIIMTSDEILSEVERAVKTAEKIGSLIVVRCSHSKCGPITTRLIGEQKMQNILVLSEGGEVNYYSTGSVIRELEKKFDLAWTGGAGLHPATPEAKRFWTQWGGTVPQNAFCGAYPDQEEFLAYIVNNFSER